jgi:hypothetical protein
MFMFMKRFLIIAAIGLMPWLAKAQFTCALSNQPVNAVIWAGCSATFTLSQTGAPPMVCEWQFNDTYIPDGFITTFAGGVASRVDGGPATNSYLHPRSLAFDATGNLYCADDDGNTISGFIRKITPSGIITTVAGNGNGNIYSGDGKAGTNTAIVVGDLCFDRKGNLYFVGGDCSHRVHRLGTNGVVTSVAGNGNTAYSGDGGYATNAGMNPAFITVDTPGNLYIAEGYPFRIRKVDTNGIITTVVGNGIAAFAGDGGYATNASLSNVMGVKVDSTGNLYILDNALATGASRIRKVDTNGIITTVVGDGSGRPCLPGTDNGILAVKDPLFASSFGLDTTGNLLISDVGSRLVKVVDRGYIYYLAGTGTSGYSGDGGPALNACLNYPMGITADPSGTVYLADNGNHRIRKITCAKKTVYAVNNATIADSGTYRVLSYLTNGDCVTSAEVSLTVTTNPIISRAVCNLPGNLTLNLVNRPGSTNVVLMATNLVPPVNWRPVATNVAGADGNWQFTDTKLNAPRQYYRSATRCK